MPASFRKIGPEVGLGGGAGLHGDEVQGLDKAISQLQSMQTKVVDGAAADTDIPVAGLSDESVLQSVIEYAAGVPEDQTAAASVVDGDLQVSNDTTGSKLVVTFYG